MFEVTRTGWGIEAIRRYGDPLLVRVVCPRCGRVQTLREFQELGFGPELGVATFGSSCIDSYAYHDGKPVCNYPHGGLMAETRIVVVDGKHRWPQFDFADSPLAPVEAAPQTTA